MKTERTLLLSLMFGCAAPEAVDPEQQYELVFEELVLSQSWETRPLSEDALEDQGALEPCEQGWESLESHLALDTSMCDYFLLGQPAAISVRAGDELEIALWQGLLSSLEPAEAHIAILRGSDLLWERRTPIPAASELIQETWASPVDIEVGDPLLIHLHNHGDNTWDLLRLRGQTRVASP